MKKYHPNQAVRAGYALLDVILAVALFAITVTGLMRVMQRVNETSSGFARDRYIQQQLEGLLSERRKMTVEEMNYNMTDELSGVAFRTFVESFTVDNGEGNELTDLYKLTAEATFLDDGGEQIERAELIIYQPET